MKKTVIGLLLSMMILSGISSAGNITVENRNSASSCNSKETLDKYVYLSPEYTVSDKPWDTFKNTVDSLIKKGSTSVQIRRNGVITDCNDWNTSSIVVSSRDTNGASIIVNRDGCDFDKPSYTKISNPTAIDAQIHYTIGYARVWEGGSKTYSGKLYHKDYTDTNWTCYPGGNKVTDNQDCPKVTVKYVDETKYHTGECINYRVFRCGDGLVNGRDKNGNEITIYDNNVNYNEPCDPASPDWKNRPDGKTCSATCKIVEPKDPVCGSIYNNQTKYTDYSSEQWLLKSTDKLCDEGSVVDFDFLPKIGGPRIYTWNCKNGSKKTSQACTAKQIWCGDGEKNGKEDCDDGEKNGTSESLCSKTCTTVGGVSCGTKDKGDTYFDKKQTTPWLTKTSTGMCGTGLTVGAPILTGSDSHLEWTCSNANGGERICKAYQEYCGDGKKNGGEACDYNDSIEKGGTEEGWGNDGCDTSCKQKNEVVSSCDEEHTFHRKLRYLSGYIFEDNFSAGSADRRLYGNPDVKFKEKMDFNKGIDPTFKWSTGLIDNDMKVPAGERRLIIESSPEYVVKDHPTKRGDNDLYIEYTIKYANKKYSTTPDESRLKTHKECVYYGISWCGDGVLDKEYGEKCDPADPNPNPEGWGNGGCSDSCEPINTSSKKGELVVDKTLSGSNEVKNTGDKIVWRLKVTASGGDVKNFTMRDVLPPVLGYSGYKISHNPGLSIYIPTTGTTTTGGVKVETVEWKVIGTLKENDYVEIELTTYAKVMPDQNYKNVLCARPEDKPDDKKCDEEPIPAPKLWIKKYILSGDDKLKTKTVNIGDEIVYRIEFGNKGDASATITSIKDFLPKNVKYKSSEIFIGGKKIDTSSISGEQSGDMDLIVGKYKVVDGVHIDIFGGITLDPNTSGYIIIKGEVLSGNVDNRVNFACIYLNDKKPDDDIVDGDRCDNAVHNFGTGLMCSKPEFTTKTFTTAGGSTTVTCKASGGQKADSIELNCGNGKIYTGSNISSLSGTCEYPSNSTTSSIAYPVVCKVNGKTDDICKDTVTVPGDNPGCFPVGTKVIMADGSQKNIEEVKEGDIVLSYNTDTNINEESVVKQRIAHEDNIHEMYELTINGEVLKVTDVHPFYVRKSVSSKDYEWIQAKELKVGNILLMNNGSLVRIEKINHYPNKQTVYNLEVETNHDYFVDKGYLVHNKTMTKCESITTDPKVTTDLSSGKDINVTCTATENAYILIDCDYKATNTYDENNKNFYVSSSKVTTFTGMCKNFTQNSKIQCLVKEDTGDKRQDPISACLKEVTIGGGGCFPAGTKVIMADGSQKNIEEVKEGDMVLSYNTETNTNEGNIVKTLLVHEDNIHEMYELTVNGEVLKVTDVHRFYVRESLSSKGYSWIEAKDLKVGNILLMTDGSLVEIEGIKHYPNKETVYNFEVENNHDYFVAEGYLVHNDKNPPCFPAGTKVTMADGTKKNIEEIKEGDMVLSYNTETNTNEGNVVKKLLVHEDNIHEMYELTVNGEVLKVTDVHRFYVRESLSSKGYSWIEAKDLKVGNILLMTDGSLVEIEGIKHYPNKETVYNFEVENNHDYFVAEGYLVHNDKRTGCFPVGTKVTMADGTKKNIEEVKEGDMVLSYNTETNTNEGNVVKKLLIHEDNIHEMYELTVNGEVLKVTDVHRFYVRESLSSKGYSWIEAKDLQVGNILLMTDGSLVEIEGIRHYPNKETVYNFEVENNHDYFVGKGYLVHNDKNPIINDKDYPDAECFDVNANTLSYEQGEILPFYWNIERVGRIENRAYEFDGGYPSTVGAIKTNIIDKNKGHSCDKEGFVALNSMICDFEIKDGKYNVVERGSFPCLRDTEKKGTEYVSDIPLLRAWMEAGKNRAKGDPEYSFFWTFENVNREYEQTGGKSTEPITVLRSNLNYIENFGQKAEIFGEYSIWLSNLTYLECNGGEWKEKSHSDVCFSPFTLTNSYTVQKTPSGNLKASTDALGKYLYCPKGKDAKGKDETCNADEMKPTSELLNAIAVSEYTPNETVNKAMDEFIKKYSKLAVKVSSNNNKTISKVPGKNIYFVEGNLQLGGKNSDVKFDKPVTFVQTKGNTKIIGNFTNLNMMLLTRGTIEFNDPNSCTNRQIVKGIFYALNGIEKAPVKKNTSLSNYTRCTQGGLTVKGVLIGKGLDGVMKNSRSNLNEWFHSKTAKTVMDGASVIIEYSPSVFTKSTMPPGAEDFTTALSIYKD